MTSAPVAARAGMMPRHPDPPLGTRDARCPPPCRSKGCGMVEGAWFFPGSGIVFGHCPGVVRLRSLLCSSSRAWEWRFPGAGEHGGGGGEAGGGFDGSNSTFHSLSRFNGRGDQSWDGVIHRDKPIPEEARRKQHCKLCYPRPASGSPAPGRLSQKAPRELDPLGFVTGHGLSLPRTG